MSDVTLPDPIVPPEVDLRDFAFMPLDVVRLRDSDLAALEPPEACWAAVLLWCASWHQVPAASVPDDDRVLANLAGFGRVVREWQKIRDGALRGWIKCSDGRLYHPVVAEKALDAWRSKLEQRWRTECSRIKKHSQRHGMSLPLPEFEAWMSAGCPQGHALPVPEDIDPLSPGTGPGRPQSVPRETHSKGQGEGQGQGQGTVKANTATSDEVACARPPDEAPQLSLVEPPAPKPKGPPDCPHVQILALWAEVLPALPQHASEQWKGARADHLRARWRETATSKRWPDVDTGLVYFRRLFGYVGQSAFLSGRVTPRDAGRKPFVCTLAWLVKPENWAKTIEGEYHSEAA